MLELRCCVLSLSWHLQEGEVKLLDTPAGALPAQGGLQSAAAVGSSSATVPLLPRSRRATADETLLRLNQYAPGSSSSSGGSGSANAAGSTMSAAGSRALIRQLSHQQASTQNAQQQQHWQGNRLWTADAAAVTAPGVHVSGSRHSAAAAAVVLPSAGGLSALGFSRVQQASAPLAVLGPVSLLGENVLGYDAEQVSGRQLEL
jgi:hypothetical protein